MPKEVGWYWIRYPGSSWQVVAVHPYNEHADDQPVTFAGFKDVEGVRTLGGDVEWGPRIPESEESRG